MSFIQTIFVHFMKAINNKVKNNYEIFSIQLMFRIKTKE